MKRLAALVFFCVVASTYAFDVSVNVQKNFQTIEGFGFFGGSQVWWDANDPNSFFSDAWLNTAVVDFGLSMWRNEYYSEEPSQDANWTKQKPLVLALKNKAQSAGLTLNMIATVWSPPSRWKDNGSLKNGGHLLPQYYDDLGTWLVQGIKNYADAGVQLYGISPQNEAEFPEPYNSCQYTQDEYKKMLSTAGPIVRAAYPKVKIFGAERMLTDSRAYEASALKDSVAGKYLDVLAVHGYSDGVNPVATSTSANLWKTVALMSSQLNRPAWMTETSGYTGKTYMNAIFASLFYGHSSAWVHWYGCSEILSGNTITEKGNMLKHWARWVRPGAVMVDVVQPADKETFVTAFKHVANKTVTIVVLNDGTSAKQISIVGTNLPSQYRLFSTGGADRCADKGLVGSTNVSVPAGGMITLFAENFVSPIGTNIINPSLISTSHLVKERNATMHIFSLNGRQASFNPLQRKNGIFILDNTLSKGTVLQMPSGN